MRLVLLAEMRPVQVAGSMVQMAEIGGRGGGWVIAIPTLV